MTHMGWEITHLGVVDIEVPLGENQNSTQEKEQRGQVPTDHR